MMDKIDINNLTAQGARILSTGISSDKSKEQLEEILTMIGETALNGKCEFFYYHGVMDNVSNELKQRGFKISNESNWKDGTCYLIQW